mgnify:CR=1 FL=1
MLLGVVELLSCMDGGRKRFGLSAFDDSAENDVEDGGEEQAEDRNADHAEEDGSSKGLAHLGSGSGGEHEREHAEDEGEAGHQNRAQTQSAGLHSGFDAVHAFILKLLGELDDEDGVFGCEADKHDEADLREDVVVEPAQPHAADGGKQAHGHDQNDGDGHAPAFILRGEHKEDKDDAKRENVHERVTRENLLVGEIGPLDGESGGQVIFGEALDLFDHLAGADAGKRVAIDVGRVVKIVALHAVGSSRLDDFDQGSERHHVAVLIADLDAGDVGGVFAELVIGLRGDLIGAAEQIEVVHIDGTEINLQRLVQIGQRDAHRLSLSAVDFEFELRRAGAEAGDQRDEARFVLGSGEELLRGGFEGVESGVVEVLHLDFEAAGIAETTQWRRWQHEHAPFLNGGEFFADAGEQAVAFHLGRGALGEVIEDEEGRADVGLVCLKHRGITGDGEGVDDARDLLRHAVHLAHDGVGAVKGGGIGELHEHNGVSHVLRRDVAAGHGIEDLLREEEQPDVAKDHQKREADELAYEPSIEAGAEVEDLVKQAEEPAEEEIDELREPVGLGTVRLQQDGTERGAERERIEGGDDRGDGDGERELFIKLSGDAADERGGHKHGAQHQSDSDNGPTDLLHGLDGGLTRRETFGDVSLDVFDHDDGVINDDADGEHETEERQIVQRESKGLHDGQRADERHRNGEQRDDGGTPALQEKNDHEDDEQHGLDERGEHGFDRGADELGGVIIDAVVDARREALLQLGEACIHGVGGLDGVAAGELEHAQRDGVVAVHVGLAGVVAGAELDAGDITQTHDIALRAGLSTMSPNSSAFFKRPGAVSVY